MSSTLPQQYREILIGLGEDPDRVALYDDLGVRVFQLTYNRRNLCSKTHADQGSGNGSC